MLAMGKIKTGCKALGGPKLWEWTVLAALILIPFLSYFYGDTYSIIKYEVWFMGSIMEGDGWASYYEYAKYKVENGGPNGYGNYATYDFLMYVLLGIWGIPLWIFYGSKGMEVSGSYIGKIYGKSIYLVALVLCAVVIYQIARQIKISDSHAKWGAFLFASSMFVFTAVGINGQTDVLGIVFALLGLKAYIQRKRIRFIFWFMIAATFKMYALFIFVPLLLLAEKKIGKIALSCIGVLGLKIIQGFLFDPSSPAMLIKADFEQEIYSRLTTNRFPFINGDVPTVFLALLIICVACYLHKEIRDEELFHRFCIYVPMITMIGLFISFESSSYWYLHMTPYLAVMLVYNTKNLHCNILFETVALIAMTLSNYGSRAWAFEIYGCAGMLLEKIFGSYSDVTDFYMLENFCGQFGITKYVGALNVVFVVFIVTFAYMNYPNKIQYDNETPMRGYPHLRLLCNAMVCYIPLFLFVYNLLYR